MVDSELADGVRIAQLLASELVGHGDALAAVSVTDADPDVEPTTDGRQAFVVRVDDRPFATAFVHPGYVGVAFQTAATAVIAAAEAAGLRVESTATDPPRTLVRVENGAEVKRLLPVVEAAVGDREG